MSTRWRARASAVTAVGFLNQAGERSAIPGEGVCVRPAPNVLSLGFLQAVVNSDKLPAAVCRLPNLKPQAAKPEAPKLLKTKILMWVMTQLFRGKG